MGKNFMGYNNASELLTAIGNKIKAKYTKPNTGIPKSDLATAVQTSLDQISTNQANVLYAIDTGAWNLCPAFLKQAIKAGVTLTSDGTGVHITGTQGQHTEGQSDVTQFLLADEKITLKAGTYVFSGTASDAGYSQHRIHFAFEDGTNVMLDTANPVTQTFSADKVLARIYIYLRYPVGTVYNLNLTPMVMDKSIWDTLGHDYHEPSLQSFNLTRLESEDRSALAEVVDSGAKNILEIPDTTIDTNGVRFVCNKANGTIVVSGGTSSSTSAVALLWGTASNYIPNTYGGMVISDNSNNTDSEVCLYIAFSNNGTSQVNSAKIYGNKHYVIPSASEFPYLKVLIYVGYGKTLSNSVTVKPMICAKSAYDVSPKFVPYRVPITGVMSVVDKEVACSSTLTTTGIKFTATEKAAYRITATAIYYNSIPMKLVIKHKIGLGSTQGTLCTAVHVENEDVSLTVSGIRLLDVGGEFELFAQYASSTNNRFYVLVEKIG